jgi:2-amino-4-hydroxy-6-hydroxymethyldihydropteridine diphosphokinase
MATVYVSIGSNLDRETNIRSALNALVERFDAVERSRVYETESVGFESYPFYNLVVCFDTGLRPQELVEVLREIEDRHGRERTAGKRFSDRTLDLDLLLYDDLILDEPGLQLPRDEILKYAFVLCPLAELAGKELHPVEGQTFQSLWDAFDSSSQRMQPVKF